jgi:hypothetical protein
MRIQNKILITAASVAIAGTAVIAAGTGTASATTIGGEQPSNVATGLCLDDSSTYGLRGFGCNSASYNDGYQKWMVLNYSVDNSSIVEDVQLENAATGLCLDDSSAGLRAYTCSNSSWHEGYQAWAGMP